MILASILLLVVGFGGAYFVARRWVRTGSSASVFPWVAGLVTLWPLVMYVMGGEERRLAGMGWVLQLLQWLLWGVVGVLIALLGRIVADESPDGPLVRPPAGSADDMAGEVPDLATDEHPEPGASRVGVNTFRTALALFALAFVALGLDITGIFGQWGSATGKILAVPHLLFLAAGAMNMPCFMVAIADKNAGRQGPRWFVASCVGFAAVLIYAQVAVVVTLLGQVETY